MMRIEPAKEPPKLVVFEGVDGVGKTTLGYALARYYEVLFPRAPISRGSFPGELPGSLGEWVYRLHHGGIEELRPETIASSALQLLHVAAHVDGIQSWIAPALSRGSVILDRYWWSTYAYSRCEVSADVAWALVAPERPFWQALSQPVIFYVTRHSSLKEAEIEPDKYVQLDGYYREVFEREREAGVDVRELPNDCELNACWHRLLDELDLPFASIPEESES